MRNEKANLEVFLICFVSLETTELFGVWILSFPLLLSPFQTQVEVLKTQCQDLEQLEVRNKGEITSCKHYSCL